MGRLLPDDVTLENSRIRLRPLRPTDYGFVSHLYSCTAERIAYYRLRGTTPSPEQFVRDLWDGVHCQFLVCSPDDRAAYGLVSLLGYNAVHEYGRLAVVGLPELAEAVALIQGVEMFIDYVFLTFPLRKLYGEVITPNLQAFRRVIGKTFVEEGRLAEHEWFQGGRVDLHVLALTRERWRAFQANRRATILDNIESVEAFLTWFESLFLTTGLVANGAAALDLDLVDDLLFDSIAYLQLIECLDQERGIDLPLEAIAGLRRLRDVYALIRDGSGIDN